MPPLDPRKKALEDLYSLTPEAQSAIMTPGVAADYSDARDAGAGMGAAMRPTSAAKPTRSPGPAVDVAKVDVGGAPRTFQPLAPPSDSARAAVGRDTSSKGPGDAEFAAAQDEADRRRSSVALGRLGAQLSQAISGQGFDGKAYDGMAASADSPVKRLLAQREADRKKALGDPASDDSKRFQTAVSKALPGVYSPEDLAHMTAADEPLIMKTGQMRAELDARKEAAGREDARFKAQMAHDDSKTLAQQKFEAGQAAAGRSFQAGQANSAFQHQKELANLNNAADLQQKLAGAKLGPDGRPLSAGQKLPATEAAAFGDADASVQSLDDLKSAYDKNIASGFGSMLTGLTQYAPGTDATKYTDKMRPTSQAVGTFLEGGKLSNGDESKYLNMLPSPGDSADRAKEKIDNLKRLIDLKKQGKLKSLSAAGFDVEGLLKQAQASIPSTGAAPRPNEVHLLSPDGKPFFVDASEVDDALANGWKRAQ
jgi:hypothetical protein